MRLMNLSFLKNGYWGKVLSISAVLFFVQLGDAVLSDWVPAYIQEVVGSPFWMGLIISFSSMVGFGADLIFPQMFKKVSASKLLWLTLVTSVFFGGLMLLYMKLPVIVFVLAAMAVWGIYYEFMSFGRQQFVSDSVPIEGRSGAWAIMMIFGSLAYFFGPILGGMIGKVSGNEVVVLTAMGSVVVGLFAWKLVRAKEKAEKIEGSLKGLNILSEMSHWTVLAEHVWPILLVSFVLGLIDATYWTTGTVMSERMGDSSFWGGMFLPFYTLPSIVLGYAVARMGIYKGKKKIAEIFMLGAGLFLIGLGFVAGDWLLVGLSFLVGVMTSVAWPFTDAVYSDLVARMGRERKHLVGLSSSTYSMAYIVGPILAGWIASMVGEQKTFMVLGVMVTLVAVVLLLVTPKKLKLPQSEIEGWGKETK